MKDHLASTIPARPSADSVEFEPILTSEQAAAFLQIHPKTLQRMARQGRVPGYRVGDLWRFRASDLEAWLASTVVSSDRHSCRE